MDSFIKIKSLFDGKENRKIDVLSLIYDDLEILKKHISNLILNSINESTIKGKNILLKPNWVRHSIKETDTICLRTHDNFILATLANILELKPAKVTIADAPIQGCLWDKMISKKFVMAVNSLSEKHSIPVIIKDLRRRTFNPALNNPESEINPLSEYIIFDLASNSYLEEITKSGNPKFRVNDYNPDRFINTHTKGVHKYCITKELFNADVVISMPKIKTHQKAGITAALKNIVGLNGDKDFLPHHRIGGSANGGDCYPGNNKLRYLSELSLDQANRNQGKYMFKFWRKLSSALWKLSFPRIVHTLAAAWYGNDTTWRMVLDLNTIAVYGKADGTISKTPQRSLFSLCDGIIGGQGNGPLRPDPLPLGVITFSNNSALNDYCCAVLMGFYVNKIPLIANAMKAFVSEENSIILNNKDVNLDALKEQLINAVPPPGWINKM